MTERERHTDRTVYSLNCRAELDGHIRCVKLFLEEHCKFGVPYDPLNPKIDHCVATRDLYWKCMKAKKNKPAYGESAIMEASAPAFKPCEMELAMHGNCVGLALERAFRTSKRYMADGGEDKCGMTRSLYKKCITGVLAGETDHIRAAEGDSAPPSDIMNTASAAQLG